jgi:hypothetical protein
VSYPHLPWLRIGNRDRTTIKNSRALKRVHRVRSPELGYLAPRAMSLRTLSRMGPMYRVDEARSVSATICVCVISVSSICDGLSSCCAAIALGWSSVQSPLPGQAVTLRLFVISISPHHDRTSLTRASDIDIVFVLFCLGYACKICCYSYRKPLLMVGRITSRQYRYIP